MFSFLKNIFKIFKNSSHESEISSSEESIRQEARDKEDNGSIQEKETLIKVFDKGQNRHRKLTQEEIDKNPSRYKIR